jgi:hypothetical protein
MPGCCIRKHSLPILREMARSYTQLYGLGNVGVIPRNTDLRTVNGGSPDSALRLSSLKTKSSIVNRI